MTCIFIHQVSFLLVSRTLTLDPSVLSTCGRMIPEVDIDFESFSDSSGDCMQRGVTKYNPVKAQEAIQKLLDELPLDCSTPKSKVSVTVSKMGECVPQSSSFSFLSYKI